MTAAQPLDVDPIAKHGMPSDAAVDAAAEVFGAILADPERAAQIRAHMAKYDVEHPETHAASA